MLVLGLQGSPRQKGNTSYLLSLFMKTAEKMGARTHTIAVTQKNIIPCKELIVCEKKGICPIDDDMGHEIYSLLRQAEVIIPATPIFFYNATAQLKALIDRSQALWARKYRLKLRDPLSGQRKGFFLSLGATKGKQLFTGLDLTMRYFFDAVDANYVGSLTYRKIEKKGDMQQHATVHQDIETAVETVLGPLLNRKKVLFICKNNTCLSQMAGALASHLAGDQLDIITAGLEPGVEIDPKTAQIMEEIGIDMKFLYPIPLSEAIQGKSPEIVVMMEQQIEYPSFEGSQNIRWNFDDPSGQPIESIRNIRNQIQEKITDTFL